jgi:hypothetical protein
MVENKSGQGDEVVAPVEKPVDPTALYGELVQQLEGEEGRAEEKTRGRSSKPVAVHPGQGRGG